MAHLARTLKPIETVSIFFETLLISLSQQYGKKFILLPVWHLNDNWHSTQIVLCKLQIHVSLLWVSFSFTHAIWQIIVWALKWKHLF